MTDAVKLAVEALELIRDAAAKGDDKYELAGIHSIAFVALQQIDASAPPSGANAEREAKDAAYHERNQVVAALAHLFPSGIARTDIPGWEPEWNGCVYIDLPTGQVSWHYHDNEAGMFADLPSYTKPWDGHDTPEKYRRLAALSRGPDEGLSREELLALAKAIDDLGDKDINDDLVNDDLNYILGYENCSRDAAALVRRLTARAEGGRT